MVGLALQSIEMLATRFVAIKFPASEKTSSAKDCESAFWRAVFASIVAFAMATDVDPETLVKLCQQKEKEAKKLKTRYSLLCIDGSSSGKITFTISITESKVGQAQQDKKSLPIWIEGEGQRDY